MGISTEPAMTTRYAELLCKTNHSFLQGASRPSELVARAAELGLSALAVTDVNGVYGMPKAWKQVQEEKKAGRGLSLIVGTQLQITASPGSSWLTLLSRDRAAYGVMCRLITAAHAG